MDNTPTVGDLDERILSYFIFISAMRQMYSRISLTASTCAIAGSGKHRFSGHPRESARCRSCGVPLFREAPHG